LYRKKQYDKLDMILLMILTCRMNHYRKTVTCSCLYTLHTILTMWLILTHRLFTGYVLATYKRQETTLSLVIICDNLMAVSLSAPKKGCRNN